MIGEGEGKLDCLLTQDIKGKIRQPPLLQISHIFNHRKKFCKTEKYFRFPQHTKRNYIN